MRRLHCVTPWTVNRDQILEISATRLHILRLETGVAPCCCHGDVIDFMPMENSFFVHIWASYILWVVLHYFTLFFFGCVFSVVLWVCIVFVFPGLVHVGDELREVNGNLITHKRPDEISQILVKQNKLLRIASSNTVCFFSLTLWIQWMMLLLSCFWSVPVTRLHHTENYSSCCRRRQTEGKQGEDCNIYWNIQFALERVNNHLLIQRKIGKRCWFPYLMDRYDSGIAFSPLTVG